MSFGVDAVDLGGFVRKYLRVGRLLRRLKSLHPVDRVLSAQEWILARRLKVAPVQGGVRRVAMISKGK